MSNERPIGAPHGVVADRRANVGVVRKTGRDARHVAVRLLERAGDGAVAKRVRVQDAAEDLARAAADDPVIAALRKPPARRDPLLALQVQKRF